MQIDTFTIRFLEANAHFFLSCAQAEQTESSIGARAANIVVNDASNKVQKQNKTKEHNDICSVLRIVGTQSIRKTELNPV